jgi:Ion transport protein
MFDVLDQPDLTKGTRFREACRAVSQNVYVAAFFSLVTLWVLFSDDLRLAAMPPSADDPVGILSVVCMCLFICEIVIYIFGTNTYLWSFFFWLDILATSSMILDVPAVEDAIFQSLNGGDGSLQSANLARATKSSRIGTKAGRVASVRGRSSLHVHTLVHCTGCSSRNK